MNLPNNTLLQGGKYRIIRFISAGGFGCTYEAEHVMLGNRVAIKEFFVSTFCNRDAYTSHVTVGTESKRPLVEKLKKKFIAEARAINSLSHHNIVSVSDVFEENGTAYYVMSYIDGMSIADILKRQGTISEARAVRYISQVCDALAYVHNHNRLHLDIKPANIMIDRNDNVILIDFGVSKQYDEESGENTSTLIGHTVGYAPLEQIGNHVTRFSPATDIYAVGATLYKMLTGITPPEATSLASVAPLPALPNYCSQNVKAAVYAAMQLNINNRPQSIAEFLKILGKEEDDNEATLPDETGKTVVDNATKKAKQADPTQPQYIEAKPTKTTNVKTFAIALCAILAVIVGAVALFNKSSKVDEEQPQMPEQEVSGSINGHEYVDLDLSVKWATCNIGANKPSDYGDYYAWGETSTKSKYTEDNSRWDGVSYSDLQSKGVIDSNGNLCSQYDAASQKWGASWRMPTKNEIEELINECTWTWTAEYGHKGYKVTGRNGNTIFLPAAGFRYCNGLNDAGSRGVYWSATAYSDGRHAYELHFNSAFHASWSTFRDGGKSVRPVTE